MSYLVLARKYRPRTFADMVGQEVAANTLRGAITEGRVAHAYLFHGPRGTGKTTSARIFAKALNCERGPTPEPCGECERCQAADANAEADLIELDAASNRGIDAMRDLLSQVSYAPMRARFKVYILDEAHMLTKEASNALLKTLEEPPPHVKFFLATTEPEKLLTTIRSRCQIVQLAPLAEKQIAERLEWVFAREQIQAEPGVATELARRARGGLRDALSSADQLLSLAGSKPKLADLERLAGAGGADELEALCAAIEAHDGAAVLYALPLLRGGEIELCGGLLEHVRSMVVLGLCGEDAPLVEADAALRAKLVERARRVGAERLQTWLEELLAARERMRLVPAHARVGLESAHLALARPETTWPIAEFTERLQALEERLARGQAMGASPASMTSPSAGFAAPNKVAEPTAAPARAPSVQSPPPSAGNSIVGDAGGTSTRASPAPTMPVSERSSRPIEPTEAWKQTLAELASAAASLADVLRSRGR
ncbi:MAG: DNA polymerase III subunit gamma/tau, partial [Planctomycetes bacterium]|nr:DNA polymerase III subunit gamma/tau [Planctomycetota bacterium]